MQAYRKRHNKLRSVINRKSKAIKKINIRLWPVAAFLRRHNADILIFLITAYNCQNEKCNARKGGASKSHKQSRRTENQSAPLKISFLLRPYRRERRQRLRCFCARESDDSIAAPENRPTTGAFWRMKNVAQIRHNRRAAPAREVQHLSQRSSIKAPRGPRCGVFAVAASITLAQMRGRVW